MIPSPVWVGQEPVPDLVIYDVLRADSRVDLNIEVFVLSWISAEAPEKCVQASSGTPRVALPPPNNERPIRDLPERYSCTLPALRVGEDRRE